MPTSRLKNALLVGSSSLAIALSAGTSLYVVGNQTTTGTLTVGAVTGSGLMIPLRSTLSGSGQFAVQNPTSHKLKCGAPSILVRTAASPTSIVDVDVAVRPGVPQNSTGSLFTRVSLSSTGLRTATGSAVNTVDGPQYFLLDEAGGIYDYIYGRGTTGTGQGLVADFHAECYRIR